MAPHRTLALAPALVLALAFPPPAARAAAPAVTVYYFHGTVRCVTCIALEDATVRAVHGACGDLLADGTLAVASVDYDLPANAHFLDDFGLEMPGVVLAAAAGDTLTAWKRLDRLRELAEQPAELEAYIVAETRAFVRAARGEDHAP